MTKREKVYVANAYKVFDPSKLFHGDFCLTNTIALNRMRISSLSLLFKRLKCTYVACLSVFVNVGFCWHISIRISEKLYVAKINICKPI